MKVLLLGPHSKLLMPTLLADNEDWVVTGTDDFFPVPVDFIISFGYRKIIKEPTLSEFAGRMINIHTGYLPWNRGAHSNFWSWFDDTPKGVTIHHIDAGVDTGMVIAQQEVSFSEDMTLASTYEVLQEEAMLLFDKTWPLIKAEKINRLYIQPTTGGSFHKKSDIEPYFNKLSRGWDTPVAEVAEMGKQVRAAKHEAV